MRPQLDVIQFHIRRIIKHNNELILQRSSSFPDKATLKATISKLENQIALLRSEKSMRQLGRHISGRSEKFKDFEDNY
jgi:hypothetical protein